MSDFLYCYFSSNESFRFKNIKKGVHVENENRIEIYAARQEGYCLKNNQIEDKLFQEFGVNRGLRNERGVGVLTGLTNISKVNGAHVVNGEKVPMEGELWYRGYRIEHLVEEVRKEGFGFEKIAYLLLFGEMPTKAQQAEFFEVLRRATRLPTNFTRDVIMKAPSRDIMNSMTRSILTLASYDRRPNDLRLDNVIRQCIQLIAIFPMLAVYSYHAHNHIDNNQSMYIHRPDPNLSQAENFLRMLRPDSQYTELEAQALDIALILHMEHGGGNNSTFTTRVVTSSGSDTYSAIAAAMCSLKGPKHGGANIKVMQMMQDIREHVSDVHDEDEICAYLKKILDHTAFDGAGLIYGMGHAVYSLSDPREKVFHSYVEELAHAKGWEDSLALYTTVEKLAPQLIAEQRQIFKGVSPNVDFYSGFVYDMLGIPQELFTPLFAVARIVGWSAHRIEELVGSSKIIRPAYKSVMKKLEE